MDVGAAELVQAGVVDSHGGFDAESYSLEQSIPDLAGQDVLIGSAEERAVEALETYRQAQARAAEAVLNRLKAAYLAEIAFYESTETAALRQQYAAWIDTELEALHEAFLDHAEKVEPIRYELARLVGFPDPDPGSVKVPLESNVTAYRNYQAAKGLRERIKALDAAFKAEVERRMAEVERLRGEQVAAISARSGEMREEAIQRAKADADAISQSALAALESTALDTEAKLAPVPGAASSVNFGPVTVPSLGSSQPPGESRADIEAQLQVFLKAYRYQLSKNPKRGRNVTEEFLAWRRKFVAGR